MVLGQDPFFNQICHQALLGKPTNGPPELSIILIDYHHDQSNILQEPLLLVSIGPHEFKFLSRNGHCLALSRLFRSS